MVFHRSAMRGRGGFRNSGAERGTMSAAGSRLSAFAEAGDLLEKLRQGLMTRTEAVLAGAASAIYGALTPF